MLDAVDFSGRPFHFIGIGGIGMSALAYVLVERDLPVSGSDIRLNHITKRLQEQGVHIFWQQEAKNLQHFVESHNDVEAEAYRASASVGIKGDEHHQTEAQALDGSQSSSSLPQVVCSSAINANNSEYQAAIDLGCPIFHRSDILAALMKQSQGIAIAGTHGKTTTSSMAGYILLESGLDPTIVVGGEVAAWNGNARVGQGQYLVAEADESDGSLVKFQSDLGVVTNIELDHPDHYTSLDQVIQIFQTFESNCKTLIACIDCETVRQYLNPAITYGLSDPNADYTVRHVVYGATGTRADVVERGQVLGTLNVPILGSHNLSNALAAIAIGRSLGLDFATIASSLANFVGARRRFELRGEPCNISFIDDYAHHPSEIRATLAAARLRATETSRVQPRRVVAVFQPHRYSRTQRFFQEFTESFSDADVVLVTDVYSAGEPKLAQVDGRSLADAIAANTTATVLYQPTLGAIATQLKDLLQPDDLTLFLGAGNLNQVIPDLLEHFQALDTPVMPCSEVLSA